MTQFVSRWAVSSAVALLLLVDVSTGVSYSALRCDAPQELTRFRVSLRHTARAIHSGKGLVIVAIGSSSTEGVGASDRTHTYPALLATELRGRWPELSVTVINKGVGGQIAPQMLARFER